MPDPVADPAQHIIQPVRIRLGEIAQHIARHRVLVARMTDAEADAVIIRPDMGMDRAQPVVTRMAAASLQPHLAGSKVDLVMKDDDIGRGQLEIAHRLAHRLTGEVHEGLGLQKRHTRRPDPSFGDLALKFGPPAGESVILGDPVNGHKADVVTVLRVFRAGISKADNQFHARNLSCRSARGQTPRAWEAGKRKGRPKGAPDPITGDPKIRRLILRLRSLARRLHRRRCLHRHRPAPHAVPRCWRSRSRGRQRSLRLRAESRR